MKIKQKKNLLFSLITAPLAPQIIPEDCSAENNSVTVAWQAPSHSFVEGYVLELDDGSGGEFRVSTSTVFFLFIAFLIYLKSCTNFWNVNYIYFSKSRI